MKVLKVRIKLIDHRSADFGISDLGASYEEAYLVADHISMFYPNNDEDTQEEITTVDLVGGQSHSVYEHYDSFFERWAIMMKPEISEYNKVC